MVVVIIYYYIGYKYKATTWYLTGFPNGSNLESTVYYNVGEKPTVILYTYCCYIRPPIVDAFRVKSFPELLYVVVLELRS